MSATAVALILFADLSDAELDKLLKMSEAGRQLPGARGAKHRSPSWMCRMCLSGRCRFVRIGKSIFTTRRWLRLFVEREAEQTLAERGLGRPLSVRTAARGDAAADAAYDRLARGVEGKK